MRLTHSLRAMATIAILYSSVPAALANDVVILNGRVIDPETGLDAIRNVAIEDGRISAISEFPLEGDAVVDAAGHVVSPGFIDLHAHGQSIGDYRMQAMQGVTTALELESGVLPIGDWYDGQASKNLPINYGAAAGWTYGRIATFNNTDPLATVWVSALTQATRLDMARRNILHWPNWPANMAWQPTRTSVTPASSSRKALSKRSRN